MLGSIKYNLSHLLDFSGRDARQTFWYYVLFLVLANIVIGLAISLPMTMGAMSEAFNAANSGADEATMQAAIFSQIEGGIRTQMWFGVALGLIMSFLFAAAFVRRLHDSGKPGWILALALVPYLGTMLYNIANMDRILELTSRMMAAPGSQDAMAAQTQLYSVSLIGWIGYVVVIVFGVMKSEGPNKYGDESVRF